jgi:hypothetical protein|tara:strand:+ start:154 stop:471 length:318 start_codon:yes stop_codon:yes gene_type:complete
MNEEAVVRIRASESELECIIWALTVIKTMRIPVDPEWKTPYKSLLKDMLRISDNLVKEKRNQTADLIKEHQIGNKPKSRFDIDVGKEIEKAQGTLVAGCKGNDCD